MKKYPKTLTILTMFLISFTVMAEEEGETLDTSSGVMALYNSFSNLTSKLSSIEDDLTQGISDKADQFLEGSGMSASGLTDAKSVTEENNIVQELTKAKQQNTSLLVEKQQKPKGMIDAEAELVVRNLHWDCVEYRLLGLCWSWKSSWWPGFRVRVAAENYTGDQVVDVLGRLPDNSVTDKLPGGSISGLMDHLASLGEIFDTSDHSAMEHTSLAQNGMVALGRIMGSVESSFSYAFDGGDMTKMGSQWNSANPDYSENNTIYRETLVTPTVFAAHYLNIYALFPGWCTTYNIMPYYSSATDLFSWRMMATSETVLAGLYAADYGAWNQVGNGFGSVMPRLGMVDTIKPYEASVTAAYRAASIVNDKRTAYSGALGLHVFKGGEEYASGSLQNQSDFKYNTLKDHETMLLSENFPNESGSCTNYQDFDNSKSKALNEKFLENNRAQSASFTLYRPLICCKDKYKYLYTTARTPDFKRQ